MPDERITVLAAEEQPLCRESLTRLIRQRVEFELVAECVDGRAALEAIERLHPRVAVLSRTLPLLPATRVIAALARDKRRTKVVLLADAADRAAAYDAVAHGAAGCLSRRAELDEIAEAITTAAVGRTYLGRDVQHALAGELRLRAPRTGPVLTAREAEVLRLVADGCSTPAIASRLQLGQTTVKTHLAHVYEKLGVAERAAAVATAMRSGLLE